MVKRDLSFYSVEGRQTYNEVLAEFTKEFEKKVGELSIFHWVLLDRVADAYVGTLSIKEEKKLKVAQDQLQKWIDLVFKELHSSKMEVESKRIFYEKVVGVLKEVIYDLDLRRKVLSKLKEIVEGE